MKIVQKNVDSLIQYENNPRNNDNAIDKVAKSIKEYGFKVPLVIDSNNVIVSGHTRFLAALSLNMNSIPCIVADDLTPEQIKSFRLVDNKVAEFSTWDIEKLEQELIDLNLEDFGFVKFDEIEIDDDDFIQDDSPKEKKVKVCPHCGGEL